MQDIDLYKIIAERATKDRFEHEYIACNQTGKLLLHGLKKHVKETGLTKTTTVILQGEILESNGTPGQTQPPGTLVNIVYPISKHEWQLDVLKEDLGRIMGLSKADLTPEAFLPLLADCFAGQPDEKGDRAPADVKNSILRGVVCGFTAEQAMKGPKGAVKTPAVTKEGKPIARVRFRALQAENEEAAVMARRAKLG